MATTTTDLTITRDEELMVAQIEGQTDEGVEFLDGYMPKSGAEYTVVDSGRLTFPLSAVEEVLEAARENGITYE